jgi:hypothetical protein
VESGSGGGVSGRIVTSPAYAGSIGGTTEFDTHACVLAESGPEFVGLVKACRAAVAMSMVVG